METVARARKESNVKFANDGSLESVTLQIEKMASKAAYRVQSLGLPMDRDDVRQELLTGYLKAKNSWRADSGVLFVTYMTRVCWNNFNNAIAKMARDRVELGLVTDSELETDDGEDGFQPSFMGAVPDPAADPVQRLEASAALRESYGKVGRNTHRLFNALLASSVDASRPERLKDIALSLNLTPKELTEVRKEVADKFGVRWV